MEDFTPYKIPIHSSSPTKVACYNVEISHADLVLCGKRVDTVFPDYTTEPPTELAGINNFTYLNFLDGKLLQCEFIQQWKNPECFVVVYVKSTDNQGRPIQHDKFPSVAYQKFPDIQTPPLPHTDDVMLFDGNQRSPYLLTYTDSGYTIAIDEKKLAEMAKTRSSGVTNQ
jgi:hypothetical protein